MTSIKLNTTMREHLARQLLDQKFSKTEKNLLERRDALACGVYHDLFTDTDRNFMDLLPEGWLPVRQYMMIQFGPNSSDYTHLNLKGDMPFLAKMLGGCMKVYDADHTLAKLYHALIADEGEYQTARRALQHKIRAVLNSVTTVRKLMEVWPEVTPFAEKLDRHESTNLPAPLIREINAELKLEAA